MQNRKHITTKPMGSRSSAFKNLTKQFKACKLAALFLSMIIVIGMMGAVAFATPGPAPSAAPNAWKSPQQISVSMTENPQNEMIVTWTTIDLTLTDAKVHVNAVGGNETLTIGATKTILNVSTSSQKTEDGSAVTQKAFYTANLTGLSAGNVYNYVCSAIDTDGELHESAGNTFKTAPAAVPAPAPAQTLPTAEEFSFIYLSDTQTSGVNGKAMTVNSTLWAKHDPSFVLIAGDLTDTATNEGQWEVFFNQKTPGMDNANQFSDNYDSAISDYVITGAQGNHDNNILSNHFNYAASGGTNITYAYTYGGAHFIVLNFEHTASRDAQQAFLREETAYAKANNLWTIVSFHKSIYSGASHMTDSDVVSARMYWSPILAELDVDIVLQGHDHVLSRGFIDAAGNNAGDAGGMVNPLNMSKVGDRTYVAEKPSNAPLYYVGNCASTLKFYVASAGYTSNTTLAAPDYGFLDINSARPVGHAQNPDGPQTGDFDPLPTYTNVTVSDEAVTFDTYMFRYDIGGDIISTEPFLYDSFTVVDKSRQRAKVSISGTETVAVGIGASADAGAGIGATASYTISVKDAPAFQAIDFEIEVDGDFLSSKEFTVENGFIPLSSGNYGTPLFWTNSGNIWTGKAILYHPGAAGNAGVSGDLDIFTMVFNAADGMLGATNVKLNYAILSYAGEEVQSRIINDNVTTIFEQWYSPYDLNKDGVIDLNDLTFAMQFLLVTDSDANWNDAKAADFNGDNIIDINDLLLILANYTIPYYM